MRIFVMCHDPAEIARYLSCPDEGAPLAPDSAGFRCVRCSRQFPFQQANLLEILPAKPFEIPASEMPAWYRNAYLQAYSQVWKAGDDVLPWGASEASSTKTVKLRARHTEGVLRLLAASGDAGGAFCDLSAGAGHITFAAARSSRLVFHCDLSVAAVHYASIKATQMGLDNVVVVRADYFRPPFRHCIQRLTCLDSLVRGPWHDVKLLENIRQMLTPGGCAVVDFHNWWHSPLRRLGLLRQNFGENRSYSRKEVLELLEQAGIDEFAVGGFFQEGDPQRFPSRVLVRLIPATRFLVRLTASRGGGEYPPVAFS
jgi:SAM-dependent methyltransferase